MGSFSEFVANAGMHAEGALNQIKDVVQNPEVWIPTATGTASKIAAKAGVMSKLKYGIPGIAVLIFSAPSPAPKLKISTGEILLPSRLPKDYNLIWDGEVKDNPYKISFPNGDTYHGDEIILDENGIPQVKDAPALDGDAPVMETGTETPQNTGTSKAPKRNTPNSIYEKVDNNGNTVGYTYYDENGMPFSREDYDHEHGGMKPHEHKREFNEKGQPTSPETVIEIDDSGRPLERGN